MKKLEFETSNGRFLVSESDEHYDYRFIGLLSRITEEQAREIVDEFLFNANDGSDYGDEKVYKDYVTDEIYLTNPIESLHSILKSKDIHLFENPYTKSTDLNSSFFSMQVDFNKEKQAEQKTFYNPYIFKLNNK